ncbi:MAG TPA: hypothetical protein VFV35_07890 [Acidimicrobiales bacterium]|nr:hypothetical protein [Acidimicrobiales bacterium]
MGTWGRRIGRCTATALVAVAALAGCSDSGDETSLQEVIFASAEKTSEGGSSRMVMTISVEGGAAGQGAPATIDAEGAFDYEEQAGTITMRLPLQAGQPAADVEIRVLGTLMYMRFPPDMAGQLGGKEWVKIDLSKAAEGAGADLGALGSATNADPTQSLAQLRGVSDDVEELGTETLRGERVTHYRFTIDPEKAVAEAPESQRAALRSALEQAGPEGVPLEAWIDDDGRVRKLVQQVLVRGAGTTNVTLELYDFGTDVSVEAPAEADVSDLTSQVADAAKRQQQQG